MLSTSIEPNEAGTALEEPILNPYLELYYDPIIIMQIDRSDHTPTWYLCKYCCCCRSSYDPDREHLRDEAEEGERDTLVRQQRHGETIGHSMRALKRVRWTACTCLLLVAFLTSAAQWSILASGLSFLNDNLHIERYSASITSGLFTFCYFFALIGGIFGDYKIGNIKVLTAGLTGTFFFSACIGVVLFLKEFFSSNNYFSLDVISYAIVPLLFLFSASLGLCQSSVPSLIGDQCIAAQESMPFYYALFYGTIQVGAILARILFPYDYGLGKWSWLARIMGFMVATSALALLIVLTNKNIFCYKIPSHQSIVIKTAKIAITRLRLCCNKQSMNILSRRFEWPLLLDAFQAISVLKVHIFLPIFWALYFQMFELWVLQVDQTEKEIFGFTINRDQVSTINPILNVFFLILFNLIGKLANGACGVKVSSYIKISLGYVMATCSFLASTILRYFEGNNFPIYFFFIQYALMAAAEVLLYPSALELVYSSSPASMKSFIQSCLWFFIGIGNFANTIVLFVDAILNENHYDNSKYLYLVYTVLMFVTTILFFILLFFTSSNSSQQILDSSGLGLNQCGGSVDSHLLAATPNPEYTNVNQRTVAYGTNSYEGTLYHSRKN